MVTRAVIESVMKENQGYFDGESQLYSLIANPEHEGDDISRYTVTDLDSTTDMLFWLYLDTETDTFYIQGDTEEGSDAYEILGFDANELESEDVFGVIGMFDLILLETVEYDAEIRNEYLTNIMSIEGVNTRGHFEQSNTPVYYLPEEYNIELIGDTLDAVWFLGYDQETSLHSQGVRTVRQLMSALEHKLVVIDNTTRKCLRRFDEEAEPYDGLADDLIAWFAEVTGNYPDSVEYTGYVDYDDNVVYITVYTNYDFMDIVNDIGLEIIDIPDDDNVTGYVPGDGAEGGPGTVYRAHITQGQ